MAAGITIRSNETIENAIKRFRKAVQDEGILRDAKKHNFYEKPSERKKNKAKKGY